MRQQALVAIVFLSGMLNSQSASISKELSDSKNSLVEQFVNKKQTSPDVRAFNLLRIADAYLSGERKNVVDARFEVTLTNLSSNRGFGRRYAAIYSNWANQVSWETSASNFKSPKKLTIECKSDALTATHAAVRLLDESSSRFEKWNMLFIASRLLQELGDVAGAKKCQLKLDSAIRDCELGQNITEPQVGAAISVLDSTAFGYIPIFISDTGGESEIRQLQANQITPTERDFEASEKLKLRGLALADRLPAEANIRRRAHKDLALWYSILDKKEKADSQKQILFELVGLRDDRLLYPQRGTCGQLEWWQPQKTGSEIAVKCGMG